MLKFLKDFFLFPFASSKESNRFYQFLQFIGKDYPAYFWEKPSIKRLLVMPFLLVHVIVHGIDK